MTPIQSVLLVAALAAGASAVQAQPDLPVPRGRLFSLQRSQDDIHEWGLAREDVRAGRLAEAVERLQILLDRGRHGVVPADVEGSRFLGLRHAVIETLRDLPPAGRDMYERLVEREAGTMPKIAFASSRPAGLLELARRWPTSVAGRRARLLLGDLALESGNAREAFSHFHAAKDATPREADLIAEVDHRLVAARALGLDPNPFGLPPGARVPAELQALASDAGAAAIGSRESRRLLRGWPGYGANDGIETMTAPVGKPRQQSHDDFKPPGYTLTPYSAHAVGGLLGVYVNNGHEVRAYDPLRSPSELWSWSGPMQSDDDGRGDDSETTLNPDMVLACAVGDDTLVAALQVPVEGENVMFRSQVTVMKKIPARRLFAFDRVTGKLKWAHFDTIGGPLAQRYAGHDACSSPLIHDQTVYVPTHDQTGAIAFYLAAYDLQTGRQKWRRLICSSQQEVNMFGNPRFEFAASPLMLHEDVLYGVTNLGVAFAADAADGELRWVSAYPVIEMPPTRLTAQAPRDVFFSNNPLATTHGVMACTPLDSEAALGFELESGRLLWRLEYRATTRGSPPITNDVRWLLGAIDDEFFFSGRGVVAVKARSQESATLSPQRRQVVTPERLSQSFDQFAQPLTARGAIADGRLWIPTGERILVVDKQGNNDQDRISALKEVGPMTGNLLLSDGLLVSLRRPRLDTYFDRDALRQATRARIETAKDDPNAWLALGLLARAAAAERVDGQDAEEAEKAFRTGLEVAQRAGISRQSRVCRRLGAGLFELSLARARALAQSPQHRGEAVTMLRRAREAAQSGNDWLRAQEEVLRLLRDQPEVHATELELTRRRYGDLVHPFSETGSASVAVWTLWQAALHSAPAPAMLAAQELIGRYGTDSLGGENVRELAQRRQLELQQQHGVALYAPIERDAQAELEDAGDDAERLRQIGLHFPFSKAARVASLRLLDLAVQRGDLGAAARSFAQALHEERIAPGAQRRMLEAARRGGNPALAQALGARLTTAAGREPSDFPPDATRPLAEVVAGLDLALPAPVPAERPVATPIRIVARLEADSNAATGLVRPAQLVPGFAAPALPLIYVTRSNDRLEGFDLRAANPFRDPPFATTYVTNGDQQPFWLCGETLIVHESKRVRGVHHRTGEERWVYEAEGRFILQCLGVHAGVVVVFAPPEDGGEGALLLGLEPISGTLLYRRALVRDLSTQDGATPLASGGWLWWLDARGQRVQRIDPVSGAIERNIAVPAEAATRLGLRTRGMRIGRDLVPLFASDDTLYLTFEGNPASGPAPAIVALDLDGNHRWTWTGNRGRLLKLAALAKPNVVIALESGEQSGAFIQIEAQTGNPRAAARDLGAKARCLNASTWLPLPDPLIILEPVAPQSLTVLYLDGAAPSFRHRLPEKLDSVAATPVLGADFLAVLGTQRDQNWRLGLHVVGLQDRESRLPDGKTLIGLDLQRNSKLLTIDGRVLVQSTNRLALLGATAPTDEPGVEAGNKK